MDAAEKSGERPDVSSLVTEITNDAQKLMRHEFDVLRREMKDELQKGRDAAVNISLGAGAGALSALLLSLMTVHAVQRLTGIPLWLSYGLVGGMLGLGGSTLLATGAKQASDMRVVPRKAGNAVTSVQ
jgi:hypothetical protein